jgi:hypothetical protein
MGYTAGLTNAIPMARFDGSGRYEANRSMLYGYMFGLDAPLFELNDDMSVGAHASPYFGFYIPLDFDRLFDLGLPFAVGSSLMAQFNYGNFSTSSSSEEYGFGLGLGVNAMYMLDELANERRDLPTYVVGKTTQVQPAVRLSFRWWGSTSNLNTLNLTHVVGPNEMIAGLQVNRSTTQLSYIRYLNY